MNSISDAINFKNIFFFLIVPIPCKTEIERRQRNVFSIHSNICFSIKLRILNAEYLFKYSVYYLNFPEAPSQSGPERLLDKYSEINDLNNKKSILFNNNSIQKKTITIRLKTTLNKKDKIYKMKCIPSTGKNNNDNTQRLRVGQ